MERIVATWAGFVRDERGATAIEYGLIIGLMGAAIVAGATPIGQWIRGVFETLGSTIAQAQG